MQKQNLTFNNHELQIDLIDGVNWVAIKPICTALGIDYSRQFENIKQDEIFGPVAINQRLIAADGQRRKMLCLPEKYTYGWLLSIRSKKLSFAQYKLECYQVLFDHLQGSLLKQIDRLESKTPDEIELEGLEEAISQTDLYKQYQSLLSKMDADRRKTVLTDCLSRATVLKD